MPAEPQPIFAPNAETMREHVEHLFGGYLAGCQEGLIELAWTDATTHALRHASLYATDDIDALVARAVIVNAVSGCNVYIGAALRRPETAPFGRASDSDFFALTCGYVDLDEPGAAMAAKDVYGTVKPTRVVVTGKVPHPRAQLWWRLDEPITDPRLSVGLLKGMAFALTGDPTVVNPSRVMRLAGSIAWPIKGGRVTEPTALLTPTSPGQATYRWEHLARVFPAPQPSQEAPAGAAPGAAEPPPAATVINIFGAGDVTRKVTALGLPGEVIDGREAYMLKTLFMCLVQLIGEEGQAPTAQALFDLAWPQFCMGCKESLNKPRANGQPWTAAAFAEKVIYTLKRFAEGKIQGIRSIDEARAVYAQKQAAFEGGGGQGRYQDFDPGDFTSGSSQGPGGASASQGGASKQGVKVVPAFPIDEASIPVRDWIIPGLVLRRNMSVLVAPPGSGKSLLTLQIALMLAKGMPWGGWAPRARERVLVINSEDDIDEMRRRLVIAARQMGIDQVDLVDLVDLADAPENIVIARTDSRSKTVVRTPLVEGLVDVIKARGYGLVVVDPFAETFEGDENSNSEIKWAGVLWREVARRTGCGLLLVHHTKKYAGGMAGDADASRGGGALIGIARILCTLFTMTEEEATAMNVEADRRLDYVRFDDGKQNYAKKGLVRWFEKLTLTLGNATAFVKGDEVGVLQPWLPPGALDGISVHDLNLALDAIDRGILDQDGRATGQFYGSSAAGRSSDRWAGKVLMRELECLEQAAKNLIKDWLKNDTLEQFDYTDPILRKAKKGVRSVLQNRPGKEVNS